MNNTTFKTAAVADFLRTEVVLYDLPARLLRDFPVETIPADRLRKWLTDQTSTADGIYQDIIRHCDGVDALTEPTPSNVQTSHILQLSWGSDGCHAQDGFLRYAYHIERSTCNVRGVDVTLYWPVAARLREALGYTDSLEAAQARCEAHYRRWVIEQLEGLLTPEARALLGLD